jgi:hypothetical protein
LSIEGTCVRMGLFQSNLENTRFNRSAGFAPHSQIVFDSQLYQIKHKYN